MPTQTTSSSALASLNGIISTLNGIISTLNGIISTLNGIISTLNGIISTLDDELERVRFPSARNRRGCWPIVLIAALGRSPYWRTNSIFCPLCRGGLFMALLS